MEFIKQYIKIINYALMGLAFGFACFYILANSYHYLEIRKDYFVNFDDQPLIQEIEEKLANASKNVSAFSAYNYKGNLSTSQMMIIRQGLNGCITSFNNETYRRVKEQGKITIIDVYQLRESYENNILSDCIVTNLYWTTTIDRENINSSYLIENNEMIKLYVNSLLDETSYLKKDLLNNSSYFFNTTIASSSMKDNTKDGFYEVMGAYNKAASFVEFVSNWYKNEAEGNYD